MDRFQPYQYKSAIHFWQSACWEPVSSPYLGDALLLVLDRAGVLPSALYDVVDVASIQNDHDWDSLAAEAANIVRPPNPMAPTRAIDVVGILFHAVRLKLDNLAP